MPCLHPLPGSGTSQTARLLGALIPANLRLDPRELDALMVYAVQMSRHIRFWDYDETYGDVRNGDWSDFWNNDALFFLAGIGALDITSLESQYNKLELKVLDLLSFVPDDACETDPRPEAMRNLVSLIYQTARHLNDWGTKADIHPVLQTELAQMIRANLREPLRQLVQYDLGTSGTLNDYEPVFIYDRGASPFAQNWDFSYLEYTQLDSLATMDEDLVLDGEVIVPLRALFKRFLRVLMRLRDRAEFYLLEAKNGERNHQPHIVLFVAFLHLFRHLQDQLNGLTQQHLDYYYGEILQLEKRGDLPDRAHLVFQLAIGVLRDRLDAGTLFRAGKDEAGHDLLYALERDLTINQGKVAEIKTLYLSGRENNLAVIASAHEEIILDTDKKTEAPDKIDSIQPFYSLGKGGNPLAPIGFAIASMQFETSQSNRQYDLLIHCEPLLPAAFNDAFGLFRDNAGPAILQQTSDAGKDLIPIWDKHIEDISKYLAELFEISASTEKGWENIEEKHFRFHQASADELRFNYYKNNLFADFKLLDGDGNQKVVAPEEKQAIISIEFQNELVIKDGKLEATGKIIPLIAIVLRIGKKYPAITTSISGETPLSDTLPVLKMGFNREHTLQLNDYRFLYAFARLLVVKLVAVKTRADNVDKFKLVEGQNFAPVPNSEKLEMRQLAGRGVYLYSDEVFNKSIQKTFKQVVIDEGVRSARADSDLDEVVVTGHAFSQQNGYFTINLKNKNGASLTPASVVHYQDGEKRTSDLRLAGRENVKQQTDRYVWLDFPAVGEGEEYAELDISYEAVQTIFQADNFPLFETIVASGRGERKIINYFRMDDDLDQFFYLGSNNSYWPYRALHHTEKVALEVYVPVIPEGGNQPRTWRSEQQFFDRKTPFPLFPTEVLYPNFRRPEPIVDTPNWANGNLFIGVQDLQPEQMLSLLFQIIEGSEEDLKKQTPEIEWSYLSQNAWKRFPPGGVSFDSTRGDENSRRSLVQSGIVELQMPADATNTDSLVKSGFYWVRASGVENALESVLALPKMAAIYAQAARVVLHTKPVAVEHFNQSLPPKTVTQLQLRRAAVRKLEQRYPGFGGRAPESALDWYTRVSERLRHKRRAITRWDYERIVLDKFPDLRVVKCINHTHYDEGDHEEFMAGHVSMVLLPYLTNREVQNPFQPQPRVGLLEQVAGYLRGCANHFVADLEQKEIASPYLHLLRPDFQEVVVALSVRFRAGLTDVETWKLRLDEDLARFIAPWAFDDAVAPDFSRSISRMEVLYFLENRDYVDVVEDLLLGSFEQGVLVFDKTGGGEKTILSPTDAKSILSSFQRKPEWDASGNPIPKTAVRTITGSPVLKDSNIVEQAASALLPKTPFRTNHLIHVL